MAGRPRWWRRTLLAILSGLALPAFAVATNMVTTDVLPPTLRPYEGWAWPAFGVLALLLLVVGVAQVFVAKDEEESRKSLSVLGGAEDSIQVAGNLTGDVVHHTGQSVYIEGRSTVFLGDRTFVPDADDRQATSAMAPSMLPPDISDFMGRDGELAELEAALARPQAKGSTTVTVVAVAGKPGAGKSALAVHLAHQLFNRFPDGVLYVDLRGADQEPLAATAVIDMFLYAVGIPSEKAPADLAGRQALYRTWLTGKRVLIVLDNAADELQVQPLLPNRPPAAALVTSRRPLPTVCSERPLILDTLDPASATSLLWAIARRSPAAGEDSAAASVAECCSYLPLALRIAGATLLARPYWSMRKLAEALADEHTRLGQLSKEGLGRHHLDVRASVDVSYASLDADLARTFRLLGSVPAVDFTRESIADLVGLAPRVLDRHLDRLADAQLLEVGQREDRYRFHDLIRLFAQERLEDTEQADERAAARVRALDWYVELAETAHGLLHPFRPTPSTGGMPTPMDQSAALARLDMERLNLLPVVASAMQVGLWDRACRLAFALGGGYFRLRSLRDDWLRVGNLGLEAARRSGDERARAQVLLSLGSLHELTDELDLATSYCQQSLALSRQLGDKLAEFEANRILGIIRTKQERLDEAKACFERGLRLSRQLGYGWGEGAALHHLGRVYRRQGRLQDAVSSSQQSLRVSRWLRNRWGEAANLNELGLSLRDQGKGEEAIACFESSRTIYRELGDRWGEATGSYYLGLTLRDSGEPERAVALFEHSRGIYQELGERTHLEQVLRSLREASAAAVDRQEPG